MREQMIYLGMDSRGAAEACAGMTTLAFGAEAANGRLN